MDLAILEIYKTYLKITKESTHKVSTSDKTQRLNRARLFVSEYRGSLHV